jgi:formylglycine-generating enzyme required for sulfatase activity
MNGSESSRDAHKKSKNGMIAIIVVVGIAIIAITVLLTNIFGHFKPVPTEAPIVISTNTVGSPTKTEISVTSTPIPPTSTPIPPTATPSLSIGSTQISPMDGMVLLYVPAGEFTMGDTADAALAECQKFRTDCQRDWFTNEEPPHTVTLDAYWIDQTEVTNAMYAKCVADGKCKVPSAFKSYTHPSYYDNPEFANFPVIYVDWNQAKSYCEWAGRSLPTEAQWEKAARGPEDWTYPWGNNPPGNTLANYNQNKGDTTAVGSYPDGKSFYGALDMAGNVWEWVADWYGAYPATSETNPMGPASGDPRVLRGGSWSYDVSSIRSALRGGVNPADAGGNDGFRCSLPLQ